MSNDEAVRIFVERFREQGGEVEFVKSWREALNHIEREARTAGSLALATCNAEYLKNIRDRLGHGFSLKGPHAKPRDIALCGAGLTFPAAGLAETGSLLEIFHDDSDRLVSALPPVHIAYLESKKIYRRLVDAAPLIRRAAGEKAFSATLISGPSRTADIELRQVIGVHGPHIVKVLLVV